MSPLSTFMLLTILFAGSMWVGYHLGQDSQRGGETPPTRLLRVQPASTQTSNRVRRLIQVASSGARVVRPASTTLWQERGWTIRGTKLHGSFVGPSGTYEGRIENYAGRRPQFFIRHPPRGLARHEHSACFMRQGDGWRFVHFGRKPQDPDSGIRQIEKILHEIR